MYCTDTNQTERQPVIGGCGRQIQTEGCAQGQSIQTLDPYNGLAPGYAPWYSNSFGSGDVGQMAFQGGHSGYVQNLRRATTPCCPLEAQANLMEEPVAQRWRDDENQQPAPWVSYDSGKMVEIGGYGIDVPRSYCQLQQMMTQCEYQFA